MFRLLAAQLSMAAALSGLALPAAAADTRAAAARGREIAESQCARCHGIGWRDESALPAAPPFRRIRERYPIEQIAEALAEGIVVGHSDMPVFEFQPAEIDALLAYIKSIRRPRR